MTIKGLYVYRCSEGHTFYSPAIDERVCPVYRHGAPCHGMVSRAGSLRDPR